MGAHPVTAFRRASVMVGRIETSYQRAGSGAPLLLLVAPPLDLARLSPLTARWRVIVPESTSVLALPEVPGFAPFTCWIRGFLEGLGLHGVAVVADASLAVALATVQAQAPDLVTHVELLAPGPQDWVQVAAMVAGSVGLAAD